MHLVCRCLDWLDDLRLYVPPESKGARVRARASRPLNSMTKRAKEELWRKVSSLGLRMFRQVIRFKQPHGKLQTQRVREEEDGDE